MRWALAIVLSLVALPTVASDPPPSKKVFDRYCSECHAPGFGHPGTAQLQQIRGKALSILEQRKDLAAEYIQYVVRHGLWEMPPYRATEIDDAQLRQLAQYLAPGKRASKGP